MLRAHELVHAIVRVQQVTGDLRPVDRVGQERERHRRLVARAPSANAREVDAARDRAAAACRSSAGPTRSRSDLSDSASSRDGGSPARPAGRCSRPDVNQAVQERPGRDDERAARDSVSPSSSASPVTRPCSTRIAAGLAEDPLDVRLARRARARTHCAVALLVRLRARRPDRRTAAAIEQLELDAGRVDRAPHQPAERVDLANQMSLRRAADRRVARHVRDGVASDSVQSPTLRPSRAAAHAASTPACPAPITMTSNASKP